MGTSHALACVHMCACMSTCTYLCASENRFSFVFMCARVHSCVTPRCRCLCACWDVGMGRHMNSSIGYTGSLLTIVLSCRSLGRLGVHFSFLFFIIGAVLGGRGVGQVSGNGWGMGVAFREAFSFPA